MNPDALLRIKTISSSLQTLDKDLAQKLRGIIVTEFTHPLADAIRADAYAHPPHGPAAARTVKTPRRNLPTLTVGTLSEPTWAGAVFGGQTDKRRLQTRTLSSGRRILYKRRQTMQFAPHRGRQGILVFPVWERVDAALTQRLVRAVDAFVEEHLDG